MKNAHDSQNSKSSNGDKKMTTEPETHSISPNTMITNTRNNTQLENYITQRQADVLDQTRLRALSTVLRHSYDAKIVSLLLNLKSRGKAVAELRSLGHS